MSSLLSGAIYLLTRVLTLPKLIWFEAALPFLAYWTLVGIYTALGYDAVESKKNGTLSRRHVIWSVAKLHITGILAHAFFYVIVESRGPTTLRLAYVLYGVLWVDTAEYWMHRLMHTPYLYKRAHKVHHELKAPYSAGALYNDPTEGTLTSAALAVGFLSIGLAWREIVLVVTLSFLATVRQHAGKEGDFHWIHHARAQDCNFQQPFFTFWDRIMGTYYEPK